MTTREEKEKFATTLALIEELTSRCDEEQTRVLTEILSQNAETEYLKRHGLEGATDREAFKSRVPVVNHEDMKPDIQRIVDGDFSPILCAQPITEFYTSSGTSEGKRKFFPVTDDNVARKLLMYTFAAAIINSYMPGLDKGKYLRFLSAMAKTKTPGGLGAGPVLSSYCRSPHFLNRAFDPYDVYTSPIESILCSDSFQSMYTQLICGLYARLEVNRVGALFAPGLLKAIKFFQLHYRDLCHDICTGTLDRRITDPALRAHIENTMRPDPDLAEYVGQACKNEKWEGIIRKIWPNTKFLWVIVTGSMAQYIPTLDYYSGGLPKVSAIYGSSECFFGVNLKPLCDPLDITYTILPNMGYFEFILVNSPTDLTENPMARLVDLADVEVGKEYEIVVTTYAGLYRYQVGDVLYVTGFHNSSPQFKFVKRKSIILNIDAEKVDELELQKAIEIASELLHPFNTSIVDYTSYVNIKTIPGHYVIYWELVSRGSSNRPVKEVLDQCCLEMENALNLVYRQYRVIIQSIGPLEIRVVKSGTFEKLMEYAISEGASISQYKVPKCVKAIPMVELLDSRVMSVHFSPCMPHL